MILEKDAMQLLKRGCDEILIEAGRDDVIVGMQHKRPDPVPVLVAYIRGMTAASGCAGVRDGRNANGLSFG